MQKSAHYSIRGFDRSSSEEIELFNLMAYHPTTLKARGYWKSKFNYARDVDLGSTKNSFFWTRQQLSRKVEDVAYAVADKLDKIVGWIWFYQDSQHPLPARVVSELGLTSRNSRVYQLSYEKLMSEGWPEELIAKAQHVKVGYLTKTRKGVIVEGLRLAILRLRRMYRKLYVRPRKLVLYAYVHPRNRASSIVLERNGFELYPRRYSYDGVGHRLWVKVV